MEYGSEWPNDSLKCIQCYMMDNDTLWIIKYVIKLMRWHLCFCFGFWMHLSLSLSLRNSITSIQIIHHNFSSSFLVSQPTEIVQHRTSNIVKLVGLILLLPVHCGFRFLLAHSNHNSILKKKEKIAQRLK